MVMRLCTLRHFGWLLVLPFVILSLIPAAVMPMRGSDGTMVLVLCTGDGPVETVVTLPGGADAPDVQPRCDWAAAGAPALLPDIILPARPVSFAESHLPSTTDKAALSHRPSGAMPRGPPSTL